MLDPFLGSGSTAVAAVRTGRHYVGYDTDPDYLALAETRLAEARAAGPTDPGPDRAGPNPDGFSAPGRSGYRRSP